MFPELELDAKADQLVVDLEHVEEVTVRLGDLGITVGAREDDARLGLSLLSDLQEDGPDGAKRLVGDVDPPLAELRRGYAAQFHGWVPDLAKNRVTSVVVGFPNPNIHLGVLPIKADEPAKVLGSAGTGVRVGFVDTKWYPHPALDAVAVEREAVLSDDDEPWPMRAGHAAFVAHLILAQAPGAHLTLRWALKADGTGTLWQAAKQIASFADEKVDVLNLSLGVRTLDSQPPLLLTRALAALDPDTVVVASAGNHGTIQGMVNGLRANSPTWPAALPRVIAVGAPAVYSPEAPWVDLKAEGTAVSAYLKGKVEFPGGGTEKFHGWAEWAGTSFAAARVTGQIAARVVPGQVTAREAAAEVLAAASG
ncbi:S8 family peptidase [Actinokineospora sp. HUAS TT18]|uniref:S8 family peptidase n=1 Tax=Actinokineospora sp. HUAS TT18 TaxID=3447451 RepID=UPI003F528540